MGKFSGVCGSLGVPVAHGDQWGQRDVTRRRVWGTQHVQWWRQGYQGSRARSRWRTVVGRNLGRRGGTCQMVGLHIAYQRCG